MTDFFTNVGDSLRVAGQQRRLMQEQYFQGNNTGSIKDSIFTRKAEVQQSNNGNSYDTMGLLNEPFSVPSGQVQQAKTQTEAVPAESRAIQESGSHTEERGAVQEATVAEETPTPAPAVERKTVQKTPASRNTEVTESHKAAGGLHSPVELSDALTEEEVHAELRKKLIDSGEKYIPALPGEISEGDFFKFNQKEMVCRDSSGKTQNIQGKIGGLNDFWDKNPDVFTITDNSSGSDHKYLYRKAGVNDKGQPVYKCVSMNGNPITTDNQYTLQWTEDGSPELVQYNDQDNYGVGLQVGKNDNKPSEYKIAPGDYTGDEGAYETAPGDYTGDEDAVRTDAPKDNPPQVWLNKQPGTGQLSLDDIKQDLISKCDNTSRPLTDAEKEAVTQCQSEQEAIEYLRSLGIQVGFAM